VALRISPTQKSLIGLDIGSSAVKAVALQARGDTYDIKSLAWTPITSSAPDAVPGEDDVVQATRQCLETLGTKSPYAVCGLAGHEVVVRSFGFPDLAPEEIPGAVHLEALQVCPFNVEQSFVDFQLVTNHTDSRETTPGQGRAASAVQGILAAATREAIRSKQQIVHQTGGKCVLMDVDGLALLNALQTLDPGPDQTLSVLNVGYRHSTVAILPPDGLPFVRDINFAGQLMVEMVCRRTNLTPAAVHAALQEPGQKRTLAQIQPAFKEACQHLADEVAETLRYYSAQQAQHPVEHIALCGGFALSTGFSRQMQDWLGHYRLFLWNPLEPINRNQAAADAPLLALGPGFAVAVGLAMRSL